MQSYCVRTFDYDTSMVGAAKLHDTVVPVYERIDTVVAQILGGGSQETSSRMRLSGPFGGCGLRATAIAPHAHAAYWAAQALNTAKLKEVRLAAGELAGGTSQRTQRVDTDMQLAV